jgi:hypothetical protein
MGAVSFSFEGRKRDLCKLIRCICGGKCKTQRITRVVMYRVNGFSFISKGPIMLQVRDTELPAKVSVTVAFKNAKGHPASVDGAPTWVASDPTIIDSITVAPDGLSAEFHVMDKLGASTLTVTADVDLGEGVKSTDFVDTVTVIAGEAVAADFTFGTVTPDA